MTTTSTRDGADSHARRSLRPASSFYVGMSALFVVIVAVGFAPTFYLRPYILPSDVFVRHGPALPLHVLAGKTYLAPAAAARLAEGVTRVQLTPREMVVLGLLADGKANKEIANALDISERTVKTHLAHLFEKLGVTSRTEAIRVATRRGLVRMD